MHQKQVDSIRLQMFSEMPLDNLRDKVYDEAVEHYRTSARETYWRDRKFWLGSHARAALKNRWEAERECAGAVCSRLWMWGEEHDVKISEWLRNLQLIELYDARNYDNFMRILNKIEKAESHLELLSIDYKRGYQKPLRLN